MTDTADFFRARLDGMVDPRHALVVLSKRLPWAAIEQALAPHFARKARPGQKLATRDLLGEHEAEFGSGISKAPEFDIVRAEFSAPRRKKFFPDSHLAR